MAGLPEAAFAVVRYAHCKADKQGKVCVDGPHRYSTDPSLAGRRVIVGLGATAVTVYTESGELVCEHERQYGPAPRTRRTPRASCPC